MKKLIILFIALFVFGNLFSQTEIWYKLSPEIRLDIKKVPIEIRWRPDDHIFLPNKYIAKFTDKNNFARTDIMIGTKFYKFKIFSYSKFDALGESWTGIRFDYNLSFLDKKLNINIQERYFWGLNKISSQHYYLIQYLRYKVHPKLDAGILSYGKWKTSKDFNQGYWFVGPSLNYKIIKSMNLHIAFTKDIFHEPVYMAYIRLGYKFKL